uniref:IRS-type PTB domain-containing protein n=1 Tax=Steinernema glaseri TaxID=37863 RepID=A0A1I7ZLM4_9BILA
MEVHVSYSGRSEETLNLQYRLYRRNCKVHHLLLPAGVYCYQSEYTSQTMKCRKHVPQNIYYYEHSCAGSTEFCNTSIEPTNHVSPALLLVTSCSGSERKGTPSSHGPQARFEATDPKVHRVVVLLELSDMEQTRSVFREIQTSERLKKNSDALRFILSLKLSRSEIKELDLAPGRPLRRSMNVLPERHQSKRPYKWFLLSETEELGLVRQISSCQTFKKIYECAVEEALERVEKSS